MASDGSMRMLIAIGVLALFGIITFALAAATLGTVNKHHSDLKNLIDQRTATTVNTSIAGTLVGSTRIQDVMTHLKQLEYLAIANNKTRAVGTPGFQQTLSYINSTLRNNTNFYVSQSFFPVKTFALIGNPIFERYNNSVLIRNYTYSTNLSATNFTFVRHSAGIDLERLQVLPVPNVGCTPADWQAANTTAGGALANRVVLVKRGICPFRDKASFAANFSAKAILFYNHGNSESDRAPIAVSLGQDVSLAALFLSYDLGQALYSEASISFSNVTVRMGINVQSGGTTQVGNICADTPTGDANQTIVIGSHSDSVPAGPGINDNGSGSAANLALAIALARLYQRSDYAKYKYRVRFCWWGAEEEGLLGSADHVNKAKSSTTAGERISDYLINLNYDMLGSPNFIFGIYEGQTAPNTTEQRVVNASIKISELFRNWFIDNNLPWDYTNFDGRSDYGPFLAAGVAAGGLFTGADEMKTVEQRDRYNRMLGEGRGGTAEMIQDPCYHQLCDSIQNIDVFGYEKMVQAAAYVLEYLGRQGDLKTWLYPAGRPIRRDEVESRKYDSENEYFGLSYI